MVWPTPGAPRVPSILPSGSGGPANGLALILGTGLAVLASVIGMAPRLVPWVLLVLAGAVLARAPAHAGACLRQALTGGAATASRPHLALALPVLGTASAFWSPDWAATLDTMWRVLALTAAALIVVGAVREEMDRHGPVWRRRYLRAIPIGGLCGLAYLLCEVATRGAITRTVLTAAPDLAGQRGKGLIVNDGAVTGMFGYYLNRNVAGLTLLAPPMLLAAWCWLDGARRALTLGAAGTALLLTVSASDSETAKLALAAAALAVAAACWSARGTAAGLGVMLAVGLVFSVSLVRVPHGLGLQDAAWLPFSHRDRVSIWQVNADLAERHPLLGAGVEAARIEQERLIAARVDRSQAREPQGPGWHAHNFYLQVRTELGMLGSLVALAFGTAMLAAALRLHPQVVPWALGVIAATMAMGLTGWGLWQDWFVAGLGADAAFLVLIDRHLRMSGCSPSCPAAGAC